MAMDRAPHAYARAKRTAKRGWRSLGRRRQLILLLCLCVLAATKACNSAGHILSQQIWKAGQEPRPTTRASRRAVARLLVKRRRQAAEWWRGAFDKLDPYTGVRVGDASRPGPDCLEPPCNFVDAV